MVTMADTARVSRALLSSVGSPTHSVAVAAWGTRLTMTRVTASFCRVVLVLLAIMGCSGSRAAHEQASTATRAPSVASLHAFARLYGLLRWFHPSDAAAMIDWDSFAIEGVRRVIAAPDPKGLQRMLADLISPFAPTVRLTTGAEAPDLLATRVPSAVDELVSWEHEVTATVRWSANTQASGGIGHVR